MLASHQCFLVCEIISYRLETSNGNLTMPMHLLASKVLYTTPALLPISSIWKYLFTNLYMCYWYYFDQNWAKIKSSMWHRSRNGSLIVCVLSIPVIHIFNFWFNFKFSLFYLPQLKVLQIPCMQDMFAPWCKMQKNFTQALKLSQSSV